MLDSIYFRQKKFQVYLLMDQIFLEDLGNFFQKQLKPKQENVLEGHMKSVECLTLLPNGNIVSGSYDNTIRIWSFKSQV